MISKNIANIRDALDQAAMSAGRPGAEVHLIAASKTRSVAAIRQAHAAGIINFGENYLQEAHPKIEQLRDLPLCWHFIGHVQSNKTRTVAQHFHWVHTVDSIKIAQRLSSQCPADKCLNICLQVNVDEDPAKAGVSREALPELVNACRQLDKIALRGLMTIGSNTQPATKTFTALAALFAEMRSTAGPNWDTLSMGMTGDFAAAIDAGATHVRIGTAIFGPRPTTTD